MRFTLRPVDATFLDTAPWRWTHDAVISASPEEVFKVLCDADAWPRWFAEMKHLRWTTPRPFGPGTQRTVVMNSGLVIDEHFFIWEEGRRYAFYSTTLNRPGLKALAEDYILDDHPQGCRFTYKVAVEPTWIAKAARIKPGMDAMFAAAPTALAAYLADYDDAA